MTAIRLFFRRARPAPIALSLLAVVLTVLLTLAADRLLGCFGPPPGLIYPPHSRARYKTFEYDFTAVINGLGFRDREFETPKSSTCRIIGLGDSFTYGWGVNLEQCWLKLLEAYLAAQGLTAEVANLGKPGAGPEYYTELAARAIPLMQPDLVLVAMLQGDDLQSLAAPKQRPPFLASLLKRLYPHLTAWRSRGQRADITWQETRQEWQKEAQELLAHFTGEEKARFQNVAEFVQRIFLAGELNPAVVSTAVRQPDYFAEEIGRAHV